jgi:ElaB/YqjD/DUF883 family membrane-anchored ribosome-binding protein
MATADSTARFTKDAAATVESLQEDFAAMRDDVSKLSKQIVNLLEAKGNAAYRRARKQLDTAADEASEAVRDVRDTFAETLDESMRERPLATLAMAVGIGFMLGAMWRR